MVLSASFPCQNNGNGIRYDDAAASDFYNCEAELIADGYTRYLFSDSGHVLSAAYCKSGRSVYLYWVAATKELRKIEEDASRIPDFACEDALCQAKLIQFGFDFTDKIIPEGHTVLAKTAAGQSQILRLADGSFLVIDGGVSVDNVEDRPDYIDRALEKYATRLYSVLEQNNCRPDGKIVITAWIFTHLHRDHCTLFSYFSEKYGKNGIQLKSILYNYPFANQMSHDTPSVEGKDPYLLMQAAAAKYTAPPVVFIPHTGQQIRLCDWSMEILLTYEDAFPVIPWSISTNNCSMIFRLSPAHKHDSRPRMLFLGDAYREQSEQLLAIYGDALEASIVQTAHHGYDNGGTEELYRAIKAREILWTHSLQRWAPENKGKTGIGPKWLLAAADGPIHIYPQCNHEEQGVNWILTLHADGAITAEEQPQ